MRDLFGDYLVVLVKRQGSSLAACWLGSKMEGASMSTNPRTVDEVFKDFRGRRSGMLKALTTGRLSLLAVWEQTDELLCVALFLGVCYARLRQLNKVSSHVGCDVERSRGASSPNCRQWCHESPQLVTRANF